MKVLIVALISIGYSLAWAFELEGIRKEFNLPAITLGKLESGNIRIETTGIRKVGDDTRATNSDKWHFGSNGKSVTAMLSAILIEEEKLAWETTIEDIFPEIDIHRDYRGITLRELLAHRGGVTTSLIKYEQGRLWKKFLNSKENPSAQRHMVSKYILEKKPSHDKSIFGYSNASYIIAGAILTKVTGKSWEELIEEKIFKKLSMNSCGFGAAGASSSEHALQPWPHYESEGNLISIAPSHKYADNPKALGPAGVIHCSVKDWFKYIQTHLDGFNKIDTPILSHQGFKNLHTDYDGQGYTSGGLIYEKRNGKTYLGHNGSNTLNFAIQVMDPANNNAYISVTNLGTAKAMSAVQKVLKESGAPNICKGGFCLLGKEKGATK